MRWLALGCLAGAVLTVTRRLTADDEEGREGRDAAESHVERVFVWWCWSGGVFNVGASPFSLPMLVLAMSSKHAGRGEAKTKSLTRCLCHRLRAEVKVSVRER